MFFVLLMVLLFLQMMKMMLGPRTQLRRYERFYGNIGRIVCPSSVAQ